jgi:hypothetical protein
MIVFQSSACANKAAAMTPLSKHGHVRATQGMFKFG